MSKTTSHYLHKDSVFYGRFIIKKILKEDEVFITYGAVDKLWKKKVAIMEYFPKALCVRDELFDQLVKLKKYEFQKVFYDRRQAVLDAARVMMDFHHHKGLMSVGQYVEMNNTAYIIMDYERSTSFRDYIAQKGSLNCERLLGLMKPVFLAVADLHKHKILHGYISSETVHITEEERLYIDDFGSVIPESVYQGEHRPKPSDDIMMLGALVYQGLTGNEYTGHSPLPQIREDMEYRDIPKHVIEAVVKALSPNASERYQTVKNFADHLYDESFIDPQKDQNAQNTNFGSQTISSAAKRVTGNRNGTGAIPDRPLPKKPNPVYDRGLSTAERPKTIWEQESIPEKLVEILGGRSKARSSQSRKKASVQKKRPVARTSAPAGKRAPAKKPAPVSKTGNKPPKAKRNIFLIIFIIILIYNGLSLLLSGIISHTSRHYRGGDDGNDNKPGISSQISSSSFDTELSLKNFTLLGADYTGPVKLKDFTDQGWTIRSLYYFDDKTNKVEVSPRDLAVKGRYYNAELKNGDIIETLFVTISTYRMPDDVRIPLADLNCTSIKTYSVSDLDFKVNGLGIGSSVTDVAMIYDLDLSDPEEVTYLFIRNQTEDTKIYFSFTDNTCRYFSIDYPENY